MMMIIYLKTNAMIIFLQSLLITPHNNIVTWMKNHYSFVIGSIKRGIFVLHRLQYFVEWRCVFAHHPWKISGFKRVDYVHVNVDVSKNWSGPPKWMVKIMENPIF